MFCIKYMDNIIIHISGASGSGKTTLGDRLKTIFKNKIVVKDLDNLRDEFIQYFYGEKKWTFIDENEYQNYIDNFIKKNKKPIIFVGLNDNTIYGKNKKLYYNLYSQHNYYIELQDEIVLKQKCLRLLNDVQNDESAMDYLINKNKEFIKLFTGAIKRDCDIKNTVKMNNKWKKDYKKQNYKFLSRDNIFKDIVKLLQ